MVQFVSTITVVQCSTKTIGKFTDIWQAIQLFFDVKYNLSIDFKLKGKYLNKLVKDFYPYTIDCKTIYKS